MAIALAAVGTRAHAGTLYWVPSGTASGSPPTSGAGGSGTWDNSTTPNWYNGSANTLWTSPAGQDVADFRGTAGTVTINPGESINANQLIFNTAGYIVTGDSSTSLNGISAITSNSGMATISAPIYGQDLAIGGTGVVGIIGSAGFGGNVTVGPGSTLLSNQMLGGAQTLAGGTLAYTTVAGSSIGGSTTPLNVTANSVIQFNNQQASGALGSAGAAKYYYGGLTLGANLSFDAQTNNAFFYYGMPTVYFLGGANLTANSTVNVAGLNANATSQIPTVNFIGGGINGSYTLTKTGNGNLVVGAGGNYSGLAVNGGIVSVSDAGGFPTNTLSFGGGTFNTALAANTTVTVGSTTVTAPSVMNIDQAPQSTSASTYNLGSLTLGSDFTVAENNPNSYYYGQPKINFGTTTLTGNSTFNVSGGTAGGITTVTLGPITGAYTITKIGNAAMTVNTGTGGNYAGLVAIAGTVMLGDSGGVPTAALGLAGGTVTLAALPSVTVSDSTVVTTVSVNSNLYIDQPVAAGQYGAGGAATYNLGALNLGANLNITEPNTSRFYYGEPKLNFSATTLTTNAALNVSGGTAGGVVTVALGPIVGPFTLSESGNGLLNILAGTGGNYAGLNVSTGTVTINDAGGFPTATLGLSTATLNLLAPAGRVISDTTVATTVSAVSTININQAGASGAAVYNLGSLALNANLSVIQPTTGNYYYGEPVVNFGATTLGANVTLTETGGTNGGGNLTTSVGPITGPYTLTSAGTGSLVINPGTGGSYLGLAATGGPVTISDQGGFPTATLLLAGPTLNLLAPSGKVINDPTVATTISAATVININQPGSTGAATYNLGSLALNTGSLTIQLPTPGNYYYGLPSLGFGATTLGANATITTIGANGGFTLNPSMGPVTGAFSLTKAGTANLTLTGASNYSGDTNVSTGGLIVAVGGSVQTPNMNVASGATLLVNGTLSSSTTLNVAGTATFGANPTAGSGFRQQPLAGLNIASGGVVAMNTSAARGDRTVMVVGAGGITVATGGGFDIGGNDVVDHGAGSGGLSSITAAITRGLTGPGITSSVAAADSNHLTAVGVLLNGALTSFDGVPVAPGDVWVRYTYFGDANLDGKVDGSDYSKIDVGYLAHSTGWQNGDFNYDGSIDGSDYTLIDNAYNRQGASLGAEPSILVATPAASPASAVPEPAALSVLGSAALLVGRRRRR